MNKLFLALLVIVLLAIFSCGTSSQLRNRDPDPRFVMITPDIPVKLYFTENSYKLSANQEAILDTIIEFMLLKPNYSVIVTGFQNNHELPRTANNRADNIREYIYRLGIPAGKILIDYKVTSKNYEAISSEEKLDLYRAELILRKNMN